VCRSAANTCDAGGCRPLARTLIARGDWMPCALSSPFIWIKPIQYSIFNRINGDLIQSIGSMSIRLFERCHCTGLRACAAVQQILVMQAAAGVRLDRKG